MTLDLIADSPLVRMVPSPDNVVVSAFLDVDGAAHPVAASLSESFARLIPDVLRNTAANDEPGVRTVLATMQRRVEEGFDRTLCHGVAMYGSTDLAPLSVIELPVPVETHIVAGRRPVLRPLELAQQAAHPCFVLLVDREHTRLLSLTGHQVSVLEQRFDDVPPRVDEGVWCGPRLQRHSDWVAKQHVVEAARSLTRHIAQHPDHFVFIGGPERTTAQLERLLDPTVIDRIAGSVSVPVSAEPAQLVAAVRPALAAASEAAEVELVARLRESSRVTAGLGPVLQALWERNVAFLAVDARLESAGKRCTSCGHLTLDAPQCPACGAALVDEPDIVEAALAAAHGQRADVRICQPTRLDEWMGIAALQRS